jgi:hypothetical protein
MKQFGWLFIGLLVVLPSTQVFAQASAAQYLAAGNQFYAAKDYNKSLLYYQAAAQMDPQNAAAQQGLGNSYYVLGRKQEALAAYEKAVAINPNNPQLSACVQTLRAQVGSAPPAASTSLGMKVGNTASAKNFELGVRAGADVGASSGYGLGIGGGVSGFYLSDEHLSFGGMINFYSFSNTTNLPFEYINQTPAWASGSENVSENLGSLEVLAAVKYKFDGNGIKPFLLGGAGLSALMSSESITYSYSGGPPEGGTSTAPSIPGSTSMNPMISVGAGAEFSAGQDMGVFVQGRYSVVFGNGGTFSYAPLEVGVSFNM